MRRHALGFTLVELVIVLAVLGILATIAYPSYQAQVQKSRRSAARGGVMELAMVQEREYAAYGSYAESAGVPGVTFADGNPAPGLNSPFRNDVARVANEYNEFYNFTITADKNTFSIRATPIGPQAGDATCAFYSVNQAGVKDATDLDQCW